jgi:hypothetical protein
MKTLVSYEYKNAGVTFHEAWFEAPTHLLTYAFKLASIKHLLSPLPRKDARFFIKEDFRTLSTALSQPDEAIFRDFKSTVKNEIRKDYECQLTFKPVSEEVISFYNDFAGKKGLQPITDRILKYPSENIACSVAYQGGNIVVVHVYLLNNELVRLLYSASESPSIENKNDRKIISTLNKKLHWFDILEFKKLGKKTYDWGGISNGELAGIDTFKKSFGGKETTVFIYHSYLFYLLSLAYKLFLRAKTNS